VSAITQPLQQASMLTGRQMVMAVIIGLHALVIAALMAIRVMPDPRQLLDIGPIDTLPDPPPRIVDTKPRIEPDTRPFESGVPIPDGPTPQFPVDEHIITPVPDPGPIGPPVEPLTTGSNTVAEIASTPLKFATVRSPDEFYPAESVPLQEKGVAIVRVCVGPTGRLDGGPTIQSSSGSPRLDRAAVTWAREALRFTPATRGGSPVGACKGFRVNFTLH
jgi:protein TonB